MKKTIIYLSVLLLAVSCGSNKKKEIVNIPEVVAKVDNLDEGVIEAVNSSVMDPRLKGGVKSESQTFMDEIKPASEGSKFGELGYWVGEFGENMINIHLYEVSDGMAHGYSVCAGNFREITGSMNREGEELVFDMKEPGDDKYDGHFNFIIDITGQALSGTWSPFDVEATKSKEYTLHKREYSYNPAIGEYPEASQRELTYVDVENQTEIDLGIMRNEIYARHGYSFKNKDYRHYFEEKDWYMPVAIDVREKLSDIEVANIELIYEYESYFEEYYDDYGR